MSYGINLKVDSGFISLESMSGDVPDGQFQISGHVDPTSENLGVTRRNPDGTFAGSAHHAHPVTPTEGGF